MDRKPAKNQDIAELVRQSEAARSALSSDFLQLRQRIDVPSRLRDSLKANPTGWLVGALSSGFVASTMFRRKAATPSGLLQKKRSLPVALLGLTLTAVRPLAKHWLSGQVKTYLSGKLQTPPAARSFPPSS
jgi:hypothetical protein